MYSNISAVSFCFGRTEPEKNVEMIQISLFLRVCVQKACKKIAHLYISVHIYIYIWMCHASVLVGTVREKHETTRDGGCL